MSVKIEPSFFKGNRKRLGSVIGGGIAVLSAYTGMQRSGDSAFKFEQEANFWYLTGLEYADWWVILDTSRDAAWLVRPLVSEQHQLFDGSLSDEEASRISGIRDVIDHDQARTILRGLARNHGLVHTVGQSASSEQYGFSVNPSLKELHDVLERTFGQVQSCRKELSRMRAIKQPVEIDAIKQAVGLTTKTFEAIRQKLDTYTYEYEIEADFTHAFRRKGALGHAYDPIIASGAHACTLHYNRNHAKLVKRNLILMDVGARMNGYAADITRTYAYGEPTKRQKQVHDAVEKAHREIIKLCRPGMLIGDYQASVESVMSDALDGLGLLETSDDYARYFPHAISHGLGIDVHDSLGAPLELQGGMVLTVEPGIYIPEESIGVRIEDDILITDEGPLNLSKSLSTTL